MKKHTIIINKEQMKVIKKLMENGKKTKDEVIEILLEIAINHMRTQ